jgi:hypothetical protein
VLLKSIGLGLILIVLVGIGLNRVFSWMATTGATWAEATTGGHTVWQILAWVLSIAATLGIVTGALFLMPAVSIISGTSGWFLAVMLGYTALDWPAYGWVAAALTLVVLMTIQGLGFLTPVNVMVCLELQKPTPDMKWIGTWMQRYFYAVALQGMMQVAIIVVMTRFRVGI